MAVRKGDRSQGKLKVVNASERLIAYTYGRVRDKTFPKGERWMMPKHIWDNICGAHEHIIIANGIKVETAEDSDRRLAHEKEAIGYLDSAISLIDVCHIVGAISDDRADYWTGLATETQALCKAWLKSEKSRYNSLTSSASKRSE